MKREIGSMVCIQPNKEPFCLAAGWRSDFLNLNSAKLTTEEKTKKN
jgi:hypothetical protein